MVRMLSRLGLSALLVAVATQRADAQHSSAAPQGDPKFVARALIDLEDCPAVVAAERLGDGSIKAVCNNGEEFRVFIVPGLGPVPLRCAAARKYGIAGC